MFSWLIVPTSVANKQMRGVTAIEEPGTLGRIKRGSNLSDRIKVTRGPCRERAPVGISPFFLKRQYLVLMSHNRLRSINIRGLRWLVRISPQGGDLVPTLAELLIRLSKDLWLWFPRVSLEIHTVWPPPINADHSRRLSTWISDLPYQPHHAMWNISRTGSRVLRGRYSRYLPTYQHEQRAETGS